MTGVLVRASLSHGRAAHAARSRSDLGEDGTAEVLYVEGVFYGQLDISHGVMGLPPLAGWAMTAVPFWVNANTGTTTTGKFSVDASIRVLDSGGGVGGSGEPLAEMSGLASFDLPCEKGSVVNVSAANLAVRLGFVNVDVTAKLVIACVTGESSRNAIATMEFPDDFSLGSKPFARITEAAVKLLDNSLVGDEQGTSLLTFSGVTMSRSATGWFFSAKFVFRVGDPEVTAGAHLKVTADLTTENGFPIQGDKMSVDVKFATQYIDFDGFGQFPIGECSGEGYKLRGSSTIRFDKDPESEFQSYSSITRSCEDADGYTTYGVYIEVTNWKYKSYVLETAKGNLTISKHFNDIAFSSATGSVIGHIVANDDTLLNFLTNVQMEFDFTIIPGSLSINAATVNASVAFERSGDGFSLSVLGAGQFTYPCVAEDSININACITVNVADNLKLDKFPVEITMNCGLTNRRRHLLSGNSAAKKVELVANQLRTPYLSVKGFAQENDMPPQIMKDVVLRTFSLEVEAFISEDNGVWDGKTLDYGIAVKAATEEGKSISLSFDTTSGKWAAAMTYELHTETMNVSLSAESKSECDGEPTVVSGALSLGADGWSISGSIEGQYFCDENAAKALIGTSSIDSMTFGLGVNSITIADVVIHFELGGRDGDANTPLNSLPVEGYIKGYMNSETERPGATVIGGDSLKMVGNSWVKLATIDVRAFMKVDFAYSPGEPQKFLTLDPKHCTQNPDIQSLNPKS